MSIQTVKKSFNGTQLGVTLSKFSTPFFIVAVLLLFTMLLGACSPEEIPPTPAQAVAEAVVTDPPAPPTTTLEPEPTVEPTATREPTATVEPMPTDDPTPEPTPTATMLPPLSGSGGGVIAYISEPNGRSGVQIMNADGTDQRRLTDDHDINPAWSPDGQQIIYQNNASAFGSLKMVDVGSGEITQVKESGQSPAWSPDGNRFAMTIDYELYTMDASGSAVKRIIQSNGRSGLFSPDWSADGQQLAFVVDLDEDGVSNPDIYVADADGSNMVQLTSHEAPDAEPDWSPDGTKIAFESRRDGNSEIYVMNADGSNLQNITNSPDREQRPAWSPDGSKIAFHSNRDGNWEIYVMNADGTDVQRITDNNVKDTSPEWQP